MWHHRQFDPQVVLSPIKNTLEIPIWTQEEGVFRYATSWPEAVADGSV
jgi:hypothetical protein